jgi:hypothetical protein
VKRNASVATAPDILKTKNSPFFYSSLEVMPLDIYSKKARVNVICQIILTPNMDLRTMTHSLLFFPSSFSCVASSSSYLCYFYYFAI